MAQYEDVILRIGHMGENAFIEKVLSVLTVIDNGLRDLGFKGKGNLGQLFLDAYRSRKSTNHSKTSTQLRLRQSY